MTGCGPISGLDTWSGRVEPQQRAGSRLGRAEARPAQSQLSYLLVQCSVFSVQGNLCSGEMSIREISIRYMSAVKNVAKSRMIKLLVGCLMNWKLRPAAMLLWW